MYRARSALRHGQMSEAFSTMVFLTLSGGLQDAYTYCIRDRFSPMPRRETSFL